MRWLALCRPSPTRGEGAAMGAAPGARLDYFAALLAMTPEASPYRHIPRIFAPISILGPSAALLAAAGANVGQLARSNNASSGVGMKRVREA